MNTQQVANRLAMANLLIHMLEETRKHCPSEEITITVNRKGGITVSGGWVDGYDLEKAIEASSDWLGG